MVCIRLMRANYFWTSFNWCLFLLQLKLGNCFYSCEQGEDVGQSSIARGSLPGRLDRGAGSSAGVTDEARKASACLCGQGWKMQCATNLLLYWVFAACMCVVRRSAGSCRSTQRWIVAVMLWKSISGLMVVAPPDSCSGKTVLQWEFLAEIFRSMQSLSQFWAKLGATTVEL